MKSFLDRVGVYGYTYPHERAMLASLLTGTPLLMIGHIGEAKTRVAEAMAELLLGTPGPGEPKLFQKIAADKAQFEDMIGFPNPKTLSEGHIEYAKTPISIMDKKFILIDEISRCNPQLQNKFLEVVLERQVMGIPTDIQWVWATMNPLDYPGSQPLDGALAGRMGYILQVEQTVKQSEKIINKVVSSRNYAQTPALENWTSSSHKFDNKAPQALRDELLDLLYGAGRILEGLEDSWTPVIADYLTKFMLTLKSQSALIIDGRRGVMMRYNIIANIAIQTVQQGRALSIPELQELAKEVILLSLPWTATGLKDTIDLSKVKKSHEVAMSALNSGDHLLYKIVTERDPLNRAVLYLDNRSKIDPSSATNLIAGIYDTVAKQDSVEETWALQARQFALKLALTQVMLTINNVPAELLSIVGKQYPLKFNKKGFAGLPTNPHSKIILNNAREAKEMIDLYNSLATSSKPNDWALGYFLFQEGGETFTFEELKTRKEIAEMEFDLVRSKLNPYLQKAQVSGNNSTRPSSIPDFKAIEEAATERGRTAGPEVVLDRSLAIV